MNGCEELEKPLPAPAEVLQADGDLTLFECCLTGLELSAASRPVPAPGVLFAELRFQT